MCGFSRSNFSSFRIANVSGSLFVSVKAMEEVVPFDAVLCKGSFTGHHCQSITASTWTEA